MALRFRVEIWVALVTFRQHRVFRVFKVFREKGVGRMVALRTLRTLKTLKTLKTLCFCKDSENFMNCGCCVRINSGAVAAMKWRQRNGMCHGGCGMGAGAVWHVGDSSLAGACWRGFAGVRNLL